MKILIISDSHGNKRTLAEAAAFESPELILHLGDNDSDCAVLSSSFPEIPLRAVRGNCDPWSNGQDICDFTIDKTRIFMTHGHLFGVKTGLDRIIGAAVKRGADALLFGHTHIPRLETTQGIFVINPGSIGMGSKTYAVLDISDGVNCVIKTLE